MPQISSDSPAGSEIPAYMSGARGFVFDDLIVGTPPPLSRATLVPGSQPRGSVLGLVTASGLYALSDPTASDGRQIPAAVLVTVANPAAGGFAMIATSGTFNSWFLAWSANWTLPALSAALNASGIKTFTSRNPL